MTFIYQKWQTIRQQLRRHYLKYRSLLSVYIVINWFD